MQDNAVRKKAKALLNVTAEEVKDVRIFFQPVVEVEEIKVIAPVKLPPPPVRRKSSGKLETVDFFQFYQQTIKTRVKKKLEEEEEKKTTEQYPPMIPAVTINLDDDVSHPPVLTASQPAPMSPSVEASPPKKLPRRRGGPSDLSNVG